MKIDLSASLCFPSFIADEFLGGSLMEAAMFSPLCFAKETLGMKCFWAFSDCWHTLNNWPAGGDSERASDGRMCLLNGK